MSDIETGLKSRIVVNIANWLLRTFTPNYAKLLKATIICGLEWGARDCPACRLRRNPDAVIAMNKALSGQPVEVAIAEEDK